MTRHFPRVVLLVLGTLLTSSCGGDSSTDPTPNPPQNPVPSSLTVSAGDQQQAAGGAAVAVAPAVQVRDANGQPMSGVQVQFTVQEGGGVITGGTPSSNSQGIAAVGSWTLGPNGTQRIQAQVGSLPPVTFQATITPGTEQLVATIGTGGGTFQVSDPAHPFHGLQLSVPGQAVPAGTEWRFRTAPSVPALSLPAGYRVSGPALEISTNQARASGLMTLDIPIDAGPNEGVVVVLVDPARGALEVLPMVARTTTSARVMTQHLRADLLLGRTPPAGGPLAATPLVATPPGAMSGIQQVTGGAADLATLLTITFDLPLAPGSGTLNRWPVREHGSDASPEGHGAAIAIVELVGSLTQAFPTFLEFIRPIDTPGGYLEPAPLATLQAINQQVTPGAVQTLGAIRNAMVQLTKEERDRLAHQQVTATIALTGSSAAVALPGAFPTGFKFATATAGSQNGLTLVTQATDSPVELGMIGVFQKVSVAALATATPDEVDEVLPVSSFVVSFENVRQHLQDLGGLAPLAIASAQRTGQNNILAERLGHPPVLLEVEAVEGGGWLPVEGDDVIVRSADTRLRLAPGSATTSFSLHGIDGIQVGSVAGEPMALSGIDAITSQAPLSPVPLAVVLFRQPLPGSSRRQVTAAVRRFVRAPFEISPAEATLEGGQTSVAFEVSVPMAPASGFRVHWDWGDGETSENLGLTSATHEYDEPGNYTVVATLKSADGNTILAVDTAAVRGDDEVWVGTATMTIRVLSGDAHFEWVLKGEGLRFEPTENSPAGTIQYDLVSGQISTVSIQVLPSSPCAWSVTAPGSLPLADGGYLSFLLPESDQGSTSSSGPLPYRIFINVVQIASGAGGTVQCPDEDPYQRTLFITQFLRVGDESGGNIWIESTNAKVLQDGRTWTVPHQSGVLEREAAWNLQRVPANGSPP